MLITRTQDEETAVSTAEPYRATVLDVRVVTGQGGGPEKTILNQPRFLGPLGYNNPCAYLHPPGDPGFEVIRQRARRWGATLVGIEDRGPFDRQVIRDLIELCRREQVGIWHGHDYKSNALGLIVRRKWPMKLVSTVHGWVHHTRRTPIYYAVDRWCLPRYDAVVAVSSDLFDDCSSIGVPPDRLHLIENGIDTDEFRRSQSTAEARAALGLPADRFVIGAVGRLAPEKGFDLLIRAADQLIRNGLDLTLLIAGEGHERAALELLISELGQGDRIRLVGYQAETIAFYEALDVYALSSLREGLPNVLLEAMALDVPVVATRVAGIPRLVEHERTGLLVEAGDVSGLVEALRRLHDEPALANRLSALARATIESRFSFADRMARFSAIYDSLVGDRVPNALLPEAHRAAKASSSR